MRIAVTGEGPTDYGRKQYVKDHEEWEWGPIAIYIQRIAEEQDIDIELEAIKRHDVDHYRLERSLKGLQGKAIPARKFSNLMKDRGFENGIYYCDADRNSGTKNNDENIARKRYQEVYSEVVAGLDDVNAIPMIALRMIECWILGDKKAIEQHYSIAISNKGYPQKPEIIWGDEENPSSNYPKNYLRRIIQNSDKRYQEHIPGQADFVEIASYADIDTLIKKCPNSFAVFYEDFIMMLDRSKRCEAGNNAGE